MPSHPDESAALAIQTPAINDRSLAAGLAYAMGSRVSGMSFDPATGLLLGKVRGGAPVPYSTTAKLVRKGSGWSCSVGVCSCPVRKDCKHVAALLFAAEDNPATACSCWHPQVPPGSPASPRPRTCRTGNRPSARCSPGGNHRLDQRRPAGAAVRDRGTGTAFLLHRTPGSAAQRPPAEGPPGHHGHQGQVDPRRRFLETP